jgi:two-component system, OmpR family, KDP operon response regulator KdpE
LFANIDESNRGSSDMGRVLVIAEDANLRFHLRRTLEAWIFDVGEAPSGETALIRLRMVDYEAILIGCLEFGTANLAVCGQLRSFYPRLPILVISEQNTQDHRITAFEAGVDDFMCRSIQERELAVRLRSAIRRFRTPLAGAAKHFIAGEILLDPAKHRVEKSGAEILLTPIEFRLLELLMLQLGRAIPHSVLAANLWGQETEAHRKHLRVIIRGLRGKIEDDPSSPRYLITHSYFGYSLSVPSITPKSDGDTSIAC